MQLDVPLPPPLEPPLWSYAQSGAGASFVPLEGAAALALVSLFASVFPAVDRDDVEPFGSSDVVRPPHATTRVSEKRNRGSLDSHGVGPLLSKRHTNIKLLK